MLIYFDEEFIEARERLSEQDKALVKKSVALVLRHYEGESVPVGLGLKKLGLTSHGIVWEARAGIHWRILYLETKVSPSLIFRRIATHDQVQRFLRSFLR